MTRTADRSRSRRWVDRAVALIEADARRSADTHLLRYPLPSWSADADVQLYLKDETTHITGSLKHRLARSLFLYALCNGLITEDTATVVEVHAHDRIGALYRVARVFAEFDLDVRTAKIQTLGEVIVDAFYVTHADGSLIDDRDLREELERSLLHAAG